MKKYLITLVLYQDIVVEANSPEEAEYISIHQAKNEDWDDIETDGQVYCDEYTGDRLAFNRKEE
jgi:hypothetical protein